jgi:HD-like signal output (HDOD) protein
VKRVLFVDDDTVLLDALRTRFRRMKNAWEMEFVGSAREAIARLERQSFDVIVTDQRMPEMDGATLLQLALTRWPRTVRIVLSGYAEPDQILRLVPLAHQYVSKPCEPERLENIIVRCLGLQEMLQQPVLREVVGRMGQLPPAPRTFTELQRVMTSDSTSVADIAALVAQDTVLAAKLLQIVNSGFFRVPRRITNIGQAVGYLGLNTVRNLVVSAEVFTAWREPSPQDLLSLDILQTHAIHAAAAVVGLVEDERMASDAQLAALLHDIGYVVLSHGCADELREARRLSTQEALPLDEAERRVLGASHAEIGAYLLGIWGFPAPVVEAVAHHHAPSRVPPHGFDALAALCIAHAFTEPAETAAFPGISVLHSEITPDYLLTVNAPFRWDEARDRVKQQVCSEESCP